MARPVDLPAVLGALPVDPADLPVARAVLRAVLVDLPVAARLRAALAPLAVLGDRAELRGCLVASPEWAACPAGCRAAPRAAVAAG